MHRLLRGGRSSKLREKLVLGGLIFRVFDMQTPCLMDPANHIGSIFLGPLAIVTFADGVLVVPRASRVPEDISELGHVGV